MAIIYNSCQNCGENVKVSVGQSVFKKQLIWHTSYTCLHCGEQSEEDGIGALPAQIRESILAAEGTWSLIVQETGKRAMLATNILREAMDLSLAEAINLKKMMPGSVITGTKAETDRLKQLLVSEGFRVWISQVVTQ